MSNTAHDRNSLFLINYATQILCFVLVTPFVFLRIFVRWKLMNGLGIDDGKYATDTSHLQALANLFMQHLVSLDGYVQLPRHLLFPTDMLDY